MRPERLYLVDIVEAADAIADFLRSVEESHFLKSDLIQSAVLQKLTVIGEAAARLPAEFCDSHSEIPWRDIVGFRNHAVHEYFAVEWSIVWVSATEEAPLLRSQVAALLAQEFLAESSAGE
jgi:uncharacterized protein with HEPN domain